MTNVTIFTIWLSLKDPFVPFRCFISCNYPDQGQIRLIHRERSVTYLRDETLQKQ